jgi:hypothetical protein
MSELTEEQKFALCVAAGVPLETKIVGDKLVMTTRDLCGIAEPEPGRFVVYTRPSE